MKVSFGWQRWPSGSVKPPSSCSPIGKAVGSEGLEERQLPDWFFFYGTLMDRDVLELVLDREVEPADLVPAILHGFRRVTSPGVVYPCLVEHDHGKLTGLALSSPSPRDLVRLTWFEDGEYDLVATNVVLPDGCQVDAWLFKAIDAVLSPDQTMWCPLAWSRSSKASYLERCPTWMTGCPEPGPVCPLAPPEPARAACQPA